MKKALLALAAMAMVSASSLFASTADAQVSVRGYYRSSGTYVAPHIRSSPDGNPYNNYGYGR